MFNNSHPSIEPVPTEITLGTNSSSSKSSKHNPKAKKTKRKSRPKTTTALPSTRPPLLKPVSSPGRILAQRRAAQAKGQAVPPLRAKIPTTPQGPQRPPHHQQPPKQRLRVLPKEDESSIRVLELISIDTTEEGEQETVEATATSANNVVLSSTASSDQETIQRASATTRRHQTRGGGGRRGRAKNKKNATAQSCDSSSVETKSLGTLSCAVVPHEQHQPHNNERIPARLLRERNNNNNHNNNRRILHQGRTITPSHRRIARWYTHVIPVAEREAPTDDADGTVLTAADDASGTLRSLSPPPSRHEEQLSLTPSQRERRKRRGRELWQEYLSEDESLLDTPSDDGPSSSSSSLRVPAGTGAPDAPNHASATASPPSSLASLSCWKHVNTCRSRVKRVTIGVTVLLLLPLAILGLVVYEMNASSSSSSSSNSSTLLPTNPWLHCQCDLCTRDVWDQPVYTLGTVATIPTCGSLMTDLFQQGGQSWKEACIHVATQEFPAMCGACVPGCSPAAASTGDPHNANAWKPALNHDSGGIGLTPPIMCDESAWQRKPYPNGLWLETCHNEAEDRNDEDEDEGMIVWEARVNQTRHVRWIPSEEEHGSFGYGTYTWHLKSIQVLEGTQQVVAAQRLPPSMALRFFLHDPFQQEDYHVEIALGAAGNDEAAPQVYFGWSPLGVQTQRTGPYVAEDIVLGLDWHPGWLAWTAHIGSQTFFAHVDSSRDEEDPLLLPCLPHGPLEVHMLLQASSSVSDDTSSRLVKDDGVVQIELARFSYDSAPALTEGDACTRDCDCHGLENLCVDRRCTLV